MSDKLHQINVTYSGKEDRLLLRVTTQQGDEYLVWLTRRFTGLLYNVLNKEMEKHGGVAAVGSDQQTRKMFKAGAFEKPFEEDKSTSHPLGETGFLAFGIKTANTAENNLHLEIFPENGPGVTFNLNQQLLYMFHNLLTQGINRAEWKITDIQELASSNIH